MVIKGEGIGNGGGICAIGIGVIGIIGGGGAMLGAGIIGADCCGGAGICRGMGGGAILGSGIIGAWAMGWEPGPDKGIISGLGIGIIAWVDELMAINKTTL